MDDECMGDSKARQSVLFEESTDRPILMNINNIQDSIWKWANETFPDRKDSAMFLKIYQEVSELIDAEDDPEKVGDECADLIIMIFDYAKRKNVNIGSAINKKMEINKRRSWTKTAMGNYQHVEDKK
jgi:NTP pyrophosphatase (non-canonical NTP hydrolase)